MNTKRRVEYVALDDLQPNPSNPKTHDIGALYVSLNRFGVADLPVIDERTGLLVSGHGRRDSLEALRRAVLRGETDEHGRKIVPPDGVRVVDTETWLVPVVRGWASTDDDEARAYLIASNKTTLLGGWDEARLHDELEALANADVGLLMGTGFDGDDLDDLRHRLDIIDAAPAVAKEREDAAKDNARKRTSPIDLILSVSSGPSWSVVRVAMSMGWHPGVISSVAMGTLTKHYERYPRDKRIMFIDNEWHEYDHAQHVAAVEKFTPKYCTTRDVLTKQQAEEAGVEYMPLSMILEHAEHLAGFAENVIVIPKYDCIDDIPEKFMLGYSVPSSYGGSQLPAEAFAGRRVHLLGGPWKTQRAYLNLLGDDIVSLDNNNVLLISRFGQVCHGDGSSSPLSDLVGRDGTLSMTMYPSVLLSLMLIRDEVVNMFGADVDGIDIGEDVDTLIGELHDQRS